jgi:hypothetical protein
MIDKMFDKITATIVKMTEVQAQGAEVMKGLNERIKELEHRQDVLWSAIQGLMKFMEEKDKEDKWKINKN